MRKYFLSVTLVIIGLFTGVLHAQDFSNKGRDFWVGYGYHERMTAGGGGTQTMVLYFATEAATTVSVTIPATGYSQTYTIPANTIFTSNPLPKTGIQDARLFSEGVSNKGIHIVSDKPIVAYAHIYNQSVSGATLLFPTNTLGKEYYSINYEQTSNSPNANCWFYAIAVEPGTTTVEITPSVSTLSHQAGVPFTVNLTQGQVINIMGELGRQDGDLFYGNDLTGSRIRTISTGTEPCKRIAVFSGSGRISLLCNGIGNGQKSSDNYMVQAFPKNAWGKSYLTVPTQLLENNVYRIAVDDPSTQVRVNGTLLTNLVNNFYYQVGPTTFPNRIESDKPIMVAQYISTGRFCGNSRSGDLGDPEVIYLSPIEQTINRVILNSTPNYAITSHYVNVTIPNSGTGISSFRVDGAPSATPFIIHPQNTNYSYVRLAVGQGQHILQSDSGFNAIAYGYGDFESYGYNAGANVQDLYQFVSIDNPFATATNAAACKNSPFSLSMTFPYQPTSIAWHFNGLFPDVTLNNPTFSSTSVVNGRMLYRYSLTGTYTATSGTYPIAIEAQNPTADGCNGLQEIQYDLHVYDPPVADFTFNTSGCVSNPVTFSDQSVDNGRPVAHWYWNFGDGNVVNDIASTTHAYTHSGAFDVRYMIITDVGCKSDTTLHQVVLNDPPVARFNPITAFCSGKTVTYRDASTVPAGSNIGKWIWNFGDGSPEVIASTNADQSHVYSNTGSFSVTLQVESQSGCQSTVFSRDITVSPNPVASYQLDEVCVNDTRVPFHDASTVSAGSIAAWSWNFGDPQASAGNPNTSTVQEATHHYTLAGTYTTQLIATTNLGCRDTLELPITVNGGVITPQFTIETTGALCSNKDIIIKDASTIDAGRITRVEVTWDANDPTTKVIDNEPLVGKSYSHNYGEFSSPATRVYRVRLDAYSGISCVSSLEKDITLLATPVLGIDAVLPVCTNAPPFQLSAHITGAPGGTGIFTGTGVDANGLFTPATAGAGNHSVIYAYTAANGCSNTIVKTVIVNPTPVTDAGPDKVLLEGGVVALTPAPVRDIQVTYAWTPVIYLDNATVESPLASPPTDMQYSLTITSDQGCKTSDEVFVTLLKNPVIPNIFSPNGDGIHDRWEIQYLESYPGCVVQIFNRYGQRIHQIVNYTTPWDGRINGKDAPVGTYYYIIDPKNGRKPMTGFVDIIR